MPIYDYKCKKCEHTFTEKLMMDERKKPESEPCPECGAENAVLQQLGMPKIVSGVQGQRKHTTDFNSKLKQIHKTYGRHSKIGHTIQ